MDYDAYYSYVGVHTIAYAFPQVKIVTTAVDPEINDKFHVLPGIGNFGDRWVTLYTFHIYQVF